jgi:hypothetical protein
MRPEEAEQFDDPVLGSAVKKAYAHENAPAALRQWVASMLNQPTPAATDDGSGAGGAGEPARLTLGRRNPLYGLAAAAILLLAVGIAISQYAGWIDLGVGPGGASAQNTLPVTLAESMVVAHENCAKLPDHNLLEDIDGKDLAAIREALKASMGRPVLVAELGDGWVLQGDGNCMVGRTKSAHLLFTRRDQSVSIFSMPPVSYQVTGDGNYETTLQGHPIVGFATGRGLYCLVASDPAGRITEHDLAVIRDRIRDQLALAAPPPLSACHVPAVSMMR